MAKFTIPGTTTEVTLVEKFDLGKDTISDITTNTEGTLSTSVWVPRDSFLQVGAKFKVVRVVDYVNPRNQRTSKAVGVVMGDSTVEQFISATNFNSFGEGSLKGGTVVEVESITSRTVIVRKSNGKPEKNEDGSAKTEEKDFPKFKIAA